MFNLVQLQERLKGMPMQALMAYANGSNPEVPPYVALGELNRRKKMQESAAADQAQQMEGAPTIKDQIEQSTGLLALQGARQRQAAQQQASSQANAPMPAPNTMTSEPAQMAGGGLINSIQVPESFQRGGQVSPDIVKKLMMLKALKQRQGIAGAPLPKGMFNRANYAGGGIVAFEEGGQVKRVSGKTLAEYLTSVADTLKATPGMSEQEKMDALNRAKEQFMNSPADSGSESQESRPDEGMRKVMQMAAQQTKPAGSFGLDSLERKSIPSSSGALSRALNIKPEDVYPIEEPRKFEDIAAEQKRRKELMGIDEGYLSEREKRLADLQAKREEARAGNPMERLISFLGGISEARGGNWATQGMQGAKRSAELRAQQEALRDRQDMEMEDLKYTIAAKRDAIRRGDMQSAEALESKEKELKRDMVKSRAEMTMKQGQLETQARQAEANILQATRPTDFERQKALYIQHTQETGEKPTAAGFQKFLLGAKASTVMTMEDAIRIAAQSLGQSASMQEIQQRANELMRLGTGSVQSPAGKTIDFSQLPKR